MKFNNFLPRITQLNNFPVNKNLKLLIPLGYPVILIFVILAAFATGLSIATGTDNFEELTVLAFFSHPVVVLTFLLVSIALSVIAAYYAFHNRRYPVLRIKEQMREIEKHRDDIIRKNRDLELARNEVAQRANYIEMTNQHKSEFLANMSHELRTPLNSIIVLSQLLAENRKINLTEKQIEYARTIYTAGNDLLELINEVLDISKIESGKFDVIPESIRLQEIITELEQMFLPVARKKELYFSIKTQPGLPSTLFTDPRRLNQILRNLISNAIKFTEKGGVTVTISRRITSLEDSGTGSQVKRILFSVADTGIGIPASQFGNIFEAYRQADISTSRKYGGTGLGLTISSNLATLLGGEIRVASTEGEGSVFSLEIPEKFLKEKITRNRTWKISQCEVCDNFREINDQAAPEEDLLKINCGSEDDRVNIRKDDKTLLIIDDDTSFSDILSELAREKGYKCLVTHNGECGLRCARYFSPSAIVLDICLPGINGWQVMEKLKSNPDTHHIPVYFISGADENVEVTQMGATGFLTKPVNVDKIQDVLQHLDNVIPRNGKPISAAQAPEQAFNGLTVLLVEDDQQNVFALRSVLEEMGLKVITAGNGKDCIDKLLRYTEIDLVLMDFMMPKMDGCKAIRMIREMPQFNSLPVIVLSARTQKEDRHKCLDAGANEYLTKPMDNRRLLVTLRTWLGTKKTVNIKSL